MRSVAACRPASACLSTASLAPSSEAMHRGSWLQLAMPPPRLCSSWHRLFVHVLALQARPGVPGRVALRPVAGAGAAVEHDDGERRAARGRARHDALVVVLGGLALSCHRRGVAVGDVQRQPHGVAVGLVDAPEAHEDARYEPPGRHNDARRCA